MDFFSLQVNIAIETTYVLKVRIKNFALINQNLFNFIAKSIQEFSWLPSLASEQGAGLKWNKKKNIESKVFNSYL
jgi:hypothetical protein